MAKEVTLEELKIWLKKNEYRTWNWNAPIKEGTLEIKYLRFNLDTRDMKIFNIAI